MNSTPKTSLQPATNDRRGNKPTAATGPPSTPTAAPEPPKPTAKGATAEQLHAWWGLKQVEGILANLHDEEMIDVFDMKGLEPVVVSRLFADNTSKAVVCFFLMTVVPILVGVHVGYTIADPEEEGNYDFGNFCKTTDGWNLWATKLPNKVTAAAMLFYMYVYMEQKYSKWDGKSMTRTYAEGFAPGIIKEPFWTGLGVITNGVSLVLAGVVSIIVTYAGETPLDIVLNSIGLFFLFEIDEYLVDKDDHKRNFDTVKAQLNGYVQTLENNGHGQVQLLQDKDAFFQSFQRFSPSNTLDYWSPEKDARRGQFAKVVTTNEDATVTLGFDDGPNLLFPIEALVTKVGDHAGMIQERADGKVQLLKDEDAFLQGFPKRFPPRSPPNDTPKYWSPEKDARRGQFAKVITTLSDDPVTLQFDDGTKLDFPKGALVTKVTPFVVPYSKFVFALKMVYMALELAKWIVLFSPIYVLVCK